MTPASICHWIALSAFVTSLVWIPYPWREVCQAQAAGIYTYTDERGVLHVTNVRTDSRYVPLGRAPRQKGRASVPSRLVPHSRLGSIIHWAARAHGLDPDLIRAVIQAESGWRPTASSPKGALGLMQLMPTTASELSVCDPLNPKANIWGGARYLRQLLDRFNGNVILALAAYNAGPRRVEEAGGVPRIQETRQYIYRVLRYWQHYRSAS